MTRMVTLLALLVAAAPAGAAPAADAPAGGAAEQVKKIETFGAPLPAGETLPLARILDNPDSFAGKEVRVEGVVKRACTKKGCWMEIATGQGQEPGCRVTFKDYGFFVPKDSAGAKATLAGTVQVKTLSQKEVAHFEGEGAKIAKAADGTAKEIRIVATGVELSR